MLRIIRAALRIGTVTESLQTLQAPAPPATKGRPHLEVDRCDGDGACQVACPTTAITLGASHIDGRRPFTLDYGACIFCGRCAAACAPDALTISADYALATVRREDLVLHVAVPWIPQATGSEGIRSSPAQSGKQPPASYPDRGRRLFADPMKEPAKHDESSRTRGPNPTSGTPDLKGAAREDQARDEGEASDG